jgi:hypothetical protein
MYLDLIQISSAGGSLELYFILAYRLVLFLFFVDGLLERSALFIGLLRKDQVTGKVLELFVADQVLPVVCRSRFLKRYFLFLMFALPFLFDIKRTSLLF